MGTYNIVFTVTENKIYIIEVAANSEMDAMIKFESIPEEELCTHDNLETSFSELVVTSIVKIT